MRLRFVAPCTIAAYSTFVITDLRCRRSAIFDGLCYPSSYDSWTHDASCSPLVQEVKSSGKGIKPPSQTVLITGGTGFLGQHIIKLMNERLGPEVKEIRVLDKRPFKQKLDYKLTKTITSVVGDVTNYKTVSKACEGVDTVIHSASLVGIGMFPDHKAMEAINVTGTKNVIRACRENQVPRLLYTSTVDVVVGHDDIMDKREDELSAPKRFLMPGYGDTKCKAEELVLDANVAGKAGRPVHMQTVSLRPVVMYGEGDPFLVPACLKSAKENKGVLPKIGKCESLGQKAYVGNVAWAHIQAMRCLKQDNQSISGKAFFVADDTPLSNIYDFVKPFLKDHQMSLSSYSLPYHAVYSGLVLAKVFMRLVRLFKDVNPTASSNSVKYMERNIYFDDRKSRAELGYRPIFTYAESMTNSRKWYKNLKV